MSTVQEHAARTESAGSPSTQPVPTGDPAGIPFRAELSAALPWLVLCLSLTGSALLWHWSATRTHPTPGGQPFAAEWLIPLAGLAVGLVLFGIILFSTVTRRHALQLAHAMTAHLRLQQQPEQCHPVSGNEAICPARDSSARKEELVCMDVDITTAKQALQALKESEERLRTIVETIEEVFWIAKPGQIQATYVSPAVLKVWGHPPEEYVQDPKVVLETVHAEDRPRFVDAIEQQGRGLRTSVEYRIHHPNGSVRWVWDQGFPVFDGTGNLVAVNGLATDITERKRLESQLQQAQKMEAIGTLAGGIAHDFNNILGAIMGFAELARLDTRGNHDATQNLNEVLRASRRAKSLVQQILTFSRQQEDNRKLVHLTPIVREAAQLLRAAIPSSIRLSLDLPEDLPLVLADPTQLHQIVMNLGTNAIQAILPRRGGIEIRLRSFVADRAFVESHPGLAEGLQVELTFVDSGSGMDPQTLDHVFEPFFTTKPPGEGSGLGLSVVHGIVKSHHGFVSVESQPGAGTTVRVVLPAGTEPDAEAESRSEVSEAPEAPGTIVRLPLGRGEHVLFVDDEPKLGIVGKRVLEQCGYRVTVKHDPADALESFRPDPDGFDLVITDLTMPGMDGTGLAAQILRLRPALPVLLTTGYGTSMTRDQVRQLGLRDLLFKPTDLETLGDAVAKALDGRTHEP